jgi:RNA polymerase sigma factor (sigma-70 family)
VQQLAEGWRIAVQSRKDIRSRQEIFETIWNQYHKRILFFIRGMVSDSAEDLLQDVMLKVYQNLDTYLPRYSFKGWIYTVARNHCINQLKRKKLPLQGQGPGNDERGILSDNHNPEERMIQSELNAHIQILLDSMQPELRQMAFLRFYEGLKCREIARILDMPSGTVKSRLHRIRRTLQEGLEHYVED